MTNNFQLAINFVILDLSSDWSVSIVHPGDQFLTVEPGRRHDLPLEAALAPGHQKGSDILKVVATVDPPPGFELLTLPPLDNPIPRAADRRELTRGTSRGPLGALFAAVAADRPTRALSTGGAGPGSAGWTVVQQAVEIA